MPIVAPKWSLSSFFIERMTHRSSAHSPTCGEQLGNFDAALPVVLERKGDRTRLNLVRTFLPWSSVSLRLGVERIDLRDAAGHVEEDDALGLGAESAALGSHRVIGRHQAATADPGIRSELPRSERMRWRRDG